MSVTLLAQAEAYLQQIEDALRGAELQAGAGPAQDFDRLLRDADWTQEQLVAIRRRLQSVNAQGTARRRELLEALRQSRRNRGHVAHYHSVKGSH